MEFMKGLYENGGEKTILEFKAGKMIEDKGLIKADKRKGTLKVTSGDFLRVNWRPRDASADAPEDSYIVFPGEAVWKKVKSAKTGRVFCLKFKTANHMKFFWMQEPYDSVDDDITVKFNKALKGGDSQRFELSQNQMMEMLNDREDENIHEMELDSDGDVLDLETLEGALRRIHSRTPLPQEEPEAEGEEKEEKPETNGNEKEDEKDEHNGDSEKK